MKRNILIISLILFTGLMTFAQNGKFKNKTPKERAKAYTEMMQSVIKMSPAQLAKVEAINLQTANEMEKIKNENSNSISKWSQAMDVQKKRDKAFESVLTKQQMEVYKAKKAEMMEQMKKN